MSCVQEHVLNRCKCYTALFPASKYKINWDETSFCHELSPNIDILYNRTSCMKKVIDDVLPKCYDECKPPCNEYRHHYTTSNIHWPMKNMHISFFNDVINGQPFEKEFEIYRHISSLISAYGNNTEAKKLLKETTLIEENFAKVSVHVANSNLVIIKDKPGMSLTDLAASLGGTLNLYSGISCILIVEVIDLLYRLIFTFPGSQEVKGEKELTTPSKDQTSMTTNI